MRTAYAAALALSFSPVYGQLLAPGKPVESAPGQRTFVFKKTPQGELKVQVYLPPGWAAGQKRPAILMFFGGGFVGGRTEQFRTKAEYLASRGMVAFTPEYRVKSRHGTTAEKSVEDARSAIRWVRTHAAAFGVDPARIAGSGGSAGGTCAVLAALDGGFEAEGEDLAVSSRPNILVLYNPAVRPHEGESDSPATVVRAWKAVPGGPPMLVFFGTADETWLPGGRALAQAYARAGNRTELYLAPGQKHGFFNDTATFTGGAPGWHQAVLCRTDLFLESLGYLRGKPTVKPDPALVLKRETL
ncbi:MAG: alpha/beta hydrolase [Bryobacteraceae bacterium]